MIDPNDITPEEALLALEGDEDDGDEFFAEDDQAEADEDGDDPETDDEADEDDGEDEPETGLEIPSFLDAAEREAFKTLPPAAQAMVLRQQKALQAGYTRSQQVLSEDRKAVEARKAQLGEVIGRLGDVRTELEAKVSEWNQVDWVALKRKVSADEFLEYQAQAQADARKLQDVRGRATQAERTALAEHVKDQRARLDELAAKEAPEFLAADAGEKVIKPLLEYLQKQGYTADEITWIGAADMLIAHKAYKYDQMIARRQGKQPALTPKPDAKSNAKPVRAGARASSSDRAASKDVRARFNKTGNERDALKLLDQFD